MIKPARKIPDVDSAAIAGFRSAVRDRCLTERLDEMERRFGGVIRGLDARCKLLEAEVARLKLERLAELTRGAIGRGE